MVRCGDFDMPMKMKSVIQRSHQSVFVIVNRKRSFFVGCLSVMVVQMYVLLMLWARMMRMKSGMSVVSIWVMNVCSVLAVCWALIGLRRSVESVVCAEVANVLARCCAKKRARKMVSQ